MGVVLRNNFSKYCFRLLCPFEPLMPDWGRALMRVASQVRTEKGIAIQVCSVINRCFYMCHFSLLYIYIPILSGKPSLWRLWLSQSSTKLVVETEMIFRLLVYYCFTTFFISHQLYFKHEQYLRYSKHLINICQLMNTTASQSIFFGRIQESATIVWIIW